jgi:hypothetical protein
MKVVISEVFIYRLTKDSAMLSDNLSTKLEIA